MILLPGDKPVLFDSGFGSDFDETVSLLASVDVYPDDLQYIVNSHYHCDHVGGNHDFQERYNVPIAAHPIEARMVNERHREACSSRWLRQMIKPYTVDDMLHEDRVIHTGDAEWRVIYTPGHTLGHLSLYADGVLLAGDTVHVDDVAWLNMFREGAGAIYIMLQTLDKLAQMPLNVMYSGHGSAIETPLKRIDAARRRYERWLHHPERIGWHAVKRIFSYALMLYDGMDKESIGTYLLEAPWYADYCEHVFRVDAVDFIEPLLQEIERSEAGYWQNGTLYATAPHRVPPREWVSNVVHPENW
jgi:glyoxylase-like metal-dependent hydrolase (beta-lactamase superfamily II)